MKHLRHLALSVLLVLTTWNSVSIAEARELDIHRLFALTYQLPFFHALRFVEVEKDVLPQKVWVDCVHCPKFPDCDETAMLLEIETE